MMNYISFYRKQINISDFLFQKSFVFLFIKTVLIAYHLHLKQQVIQRVYDSLLKVFYQFNSTRIKKQERQIVEFSIIKQITIVESCQKNIKSQNFLTLRTKSSIQPIIDLFTTKKKQASINHFMQVQTIFQLTLLQFSISPCPVGQVRFSLERGQRSDCSKIYKCSQMQRINQKLEIKTSLNQTSINQYDPKNVSLRIFFRDGQKQIFKHKIQLNIVKFINDREEQYQQAVNVGESSLKLKYSTRVILQNSLINDSVLKVKDVPNNQNSMIITNFLTKGIILKDISNHNSEKQDRESQLVQSLKLKIKDLSKQIEILKQQLQLEKKANTQKYCQRQSEDICENKDCYFEKQMLLEKISIIQKSPTSQIQKVKATSINQLQMIQKLNVQIQHALKFQQLNKKLQLKIQSLQGKLSLLQKQLKDSRKMAQIKIQDFNNKQYELDNVQQQLVKSKMLIMRIWNSIQQKGGAELFDEISADVIE